jgi:PAS domain S-box-containing protein
MTRALPADSLQGSILIVDDTPAYVRLLSNLLTRHGYRIQSAGGAEPALVLAVSAAPDLILLDVKMPGMSGYAMCERLKADESTRDIPVIFISGADHVDDKVHAFACGGVDFIAKPFHDKEVLARVQTHMALRGLQKRLEERVRERTAELVAANARLSSEIVERRQTDEKFRGVLELAPEAIMLVDGRRGIVLVNSQTEALFGYRREELLGQTVDMLLPERFRRAHEDLIAGYLAQPRCRPMGKGRVLFGRCQNGREFPAEISLSPLGGGDGVRVICSIRDISERMRAEKELVDSRERLRELAAHVDAVREKERKRIAREIHDELGSLLTALKMDISLARMNVEAGTDIHGRIEQMRDLVEQTIHMVRHVATQLRPTALNLGIVPALEWLLEDFGRRTGIACAFDADDEIEMDDAQATAIFRIVQESLTNVARHAAASTVKVRLARSATGIELAVQDNGRGFDPATAGNDSFGLLGIHERALLLGATTAIDSAPGTGTTVAITIPVPKETP